MARSQAEHQRINSFLMSHGLGRLEDGAGLVAQLGYLIEDHAELREAINRSEPHERPNLYNSLKPYLRFEAKPLDVYIAELGQIAEAKQLPTVEPDGSLAPFQVPAIEVDPPQVARENLRFDGSESPEEMRERIEAAIDRLYAAVPLGAEVLDGGIERVDQYDPVERRHYVRLAVRYRLPAKTSEEKIAQEAMEDAAAETWVRLVCIECTRAQNFPGSNPREAIERAGKAGWGINPQTEQKYCPQCMQRRQPRRVQ